LSRRLKVSRRGALKAAGAGLTGMAALSVAAKVPAGALRVERLRVEWREAPVGIDTLGPLFTWKSVARDERARGLAQSAWRVRVTHSRAALAAGRGEVWTADASLVHTLPRGHMARSRSRRIAPISGASRSGIRLTNPPTNPRPRVSHDSRLLSFMPLPCARKCARCRIRIMYYLSRLARR